MEVRYIKLLTKYMTSFVIRYHDDCATTRTLIGLLQGMGFDVKWHYTRTSDGKLDIDALSVDGCVFNRYFQYVGMDYLVSLEGANDAEIYDL